MRNSRKIIFAENFKMVMAFYSTQLFLLEENVAKGTLGSIHSSAEAEGPLAACPPLSSWAQVSGTPAAGLGGTWGGMCPRLAGAVPEDFSQACGKGPCRLQPKELQQPKNRVFEGMLGTGSHCP